MVYVYAIIGDYTSILMLQKECNIFTFICGNQNWYTCISIFFKCEYCTLTHKRKCVLCYKGHIYAC